ncbi:MAG: hypothetical protein QNK37_01180 [Acidobacteriota bacterium]|nr:hypothetical protein [Acidobacteriota bacterium]
MGKLRLEPKKQSMDADRYAKLRKTLQSARSAAADARVFWDLDEGENINEVRRDFQEVAEKEKIALVIRRPRGKKCLEFKFEKDAVVTPKRIPATESQNRIVNILEEAGEPLRKGDIVSRAGISSSTWNARIKELLKTGKVIREGTLRDSTYRLG